MIAARRDDVEVPVEVEVDGKNIDRCGELTDLVSNPRAFRLAARSVTIESIITATTRLAAFFDAACSVSTDEGFTVGITINLIRGHEFDCGCFAFGKQGSTSSAVQMLGRDVILFLLTLHVLRFNGRRKWCALARIDASP